MWQRRKQTDQTERRQLHQKRRRRPPEGLHDARAHHERRVGRTATMGTSIVGFGSRPALEYANGNTADWPIIGFSPRKQDLTLYVGRGIDGTLLKALGKHKLTGGCLYIKRLSCVDLAVLEKVVSASIKETRRRYR